LLSRKKFDCNFIEE